MEIKFKIQDKAECLIGKYPSFKYNFQVGENDISGDSYSSELFELIIQVNRGDKDIIIFEGKTDLWIKDDSLLIIDYPKEKKVEINRKEILSIILEEIRICFDLYKDNENVYGGRKQLLAYLDKIDKLIKEFSNE
jgi:hypothetical protein